jgi:hypothetical protein
MRLMVLLLLFPALAAASEIYTRDGVTDGDTFYLAPGAMGNDDPAYQSWVTYSLIKSTCQLELGGEIPSSASSFDCEYRSRLHLVNTWQEKLGLDATISDAYLNALIEVQAAGFLAEYTALFFGKTTWVLPEGLRADAFDQWRKKHLRGHRKQTRITGSWNYRD